MRDEWYVARRGQDGNKRYGPVPLHRLLELVDQGRVTGNDLVWHEGMDNWRRADQCANLFPPQPAPAPRRDRPRYDDRGGHDDYRGPRRYDAYDDDRPYRRPYRPPQSSAGWVVPLAIVGGVVAVCFLGCGGAGLLVFLNSGPAYAPSTPIYSPTITEPDPPDDPNVWQGNPPAWQDPNPPPAFNPAAPPAFNPPAFNPPDPPAFNPPDPPVFNPPPPVFVPPGQSDPAPRFTPEPP